MLEESQITATPEPQSPDSFVSELGLTDENLGIEKEDNTKAQDNNEIVDDPFHFVPEDDEHTRGYILNKKWKSPLDVITEVQTLEKSLEDSFNRNIRAPDTFASPENIAEYGRVIGRPDNPEDYTTQVLANRDDNFGKDFRMHCHNAVMNDFQVHKLAESIEEQDKKVREANRASYEKELTDLKVEWGESYNEKVKLMKEGVTFLRIPTTTIMQMEKVLGPKRMRETLIALGSKSRELGPAPSAKNFKANYPTAKSAQNRMDELSNDPEWIAKYNNGDEKALTEFNRLNQIIQRGL